jgi:(p)ppGpp synthase/HD superfamily hydrolase
MATFELAKLIAEEAHKNEFAHDGITPYIEHPLAVAERVRRYGIAYAIVAVLHDVLENSYSRTYSYLLKRGFSKEVTEVIIDKNKHDSIHSYFLKKGFSKAVIKTLALENNYNYTSSYFVERGFSGKVVEALILVSRNYHEGLTYQEWIELIIASKNKIAIAVKFADITENLARLSDEEVSMKVRYKRALKKFARIKFLFA